MTPAQRRLVVAVVRVSSAVLRLVAVVPAALVYVAPVLREPLNDIGVLLVSLTVHVEGLLESRAEVAIEEDEAMRLVEALLEALVDAAERAEDFPELDMNTEKKRSNDPSPQIDQF